ncbi:YkgJ family cysteine cluster protein [Marinisporobacter balticus]|uniref:Putative zinc-or iron-chelating protein n=1 Tax=Marinisporobacter balticus TaxID=2018667 RepID=A0A4R2L4G0_9FIRM|nr:YkgJ family cysteine cluster protein [Marinisporobacter balticus]TCO78726.1 putative zinc- or iron-chelating protein [Marinisporobacter balticus]
MKKLNLKSIDNGIKTAQRNGYFDDLYRIYETIPQGKCLGCTRCCVESVPTHFIEFLNIFQHMTNERALYEKLFPKIIGYYFLEMVKKNHCPFLDDEGMCSIYNYRPLVCRSFGHLTEDEYEENYKRVLSQNIQNMKFFKNKYKILLPKEVVDHKIDYCKNFEVNKKMTRFQRQTMIDSIFTMESAFFMRGLITEDFLDTGLVSWFVYTAFDIEEAGKLRIQIMREYIEQGVSETLKEVMEKLKTII